MSPRRHDHDAGGDQELLAAKAALRDEVWTALAEARVARFPGARGRITNFTGAEAAAERLRDTSVWRAATAVKANPDSAQLPVRQRALEDGKTVYMAVPRLAEPEPFSALPSEGGGFADLEFALATAAGLVGPDTLVVTTVHELQVRPAGDVPTAEHDAPVDLVVTPDRLIDCRARRGPRPADGIRWAELTSEKIAAIPLLRAMADAASPTPTE